MGFIILLGYGLAATAIVAATAMLSKPVAAFAALALLVVAARSLIIRESVDERMARLTDEATP